MKAGGRSADPKIVKHSLMIANHRTSVTLEEPFWTALKAEAAARELSVNELVTAIDRERGAYNLSSAIRIHLFLSDARGLVADGQEAATSVGLAAFAVPG